MERTANSIVPSKSEYEKLIEKIRELKNTIAALSAEKDDLELHICREIQADYDSKVGNLEYQIMAYNLEIERLRTIILILQAALNRDENVTYEEAEEQANEQFEEAYDELNKKAEEIKQDQEYAKRRAAQDEENEKKAEQEMESEASHENAQDKSGEYNTEAESEDNGTFREEESDNSAGKKKHETPSEELKRLFRMIVKRLHPDMNPDLTEAEKQLFNDAVQAHANGDLERLREIAEMLDDTDASEKYEDTPEGIAALNELLQKLTEQMNSISSQIEYIKSQFPYTAKEFLADEEAVHKRQEELKAIIRDCLSTIEELNKRIEALNKEIDEVSK